MREIINGYFSTGGAEKYAPPWLPSTVDILDALCVDASCYRDSSSPDDFFANFGTHDIQDWNACEKAQEDLIKLFGMEIFEELMDRTEKL
jgi:hypothetical protein